MMYASLDVVHQEATCRWCVQWSGNGFLLAQPMMYAVLHLVHHEATCHAVCKGLMFASFVDLT